MMPSSTVRILLVINALDYGGTERAVEQCAILLRSRGHEVLALSLMPPGRIGRGLADHGIPLSTLGMGDTVGLGDIWRGARSLSRVIRGWRPDVVHGFLARANIISRLGNRLAGSPAAHVSGERSTDFRRTQQVVRLNRWTARWTDRVLAVSALVREVLVTRDGIPPERIAILENGIDCTLVDDVPIVPLRQEFPGLSGATLVFCSAGRFALDKGFVHLIRAFAAMQPTGGVHLLLVGDGPEHAAVRAEVRARGLGDRVHFTGYRADVLGLLKSADAYVMPSLQEGAPMALLEAMACRLPTIATDVSGVQELADADGDPTCLVVPPAIDWSAPVLGRVVTNTEAERVGMMAAAMDRLAADPALRRRLADAAGRRVRAHYTLDHVVDRLVEHYAGVTTGRWQCS